jgi:hypothetical protein
VNWHLSIDGDAAVFSVHAPLSPDEARRLAALADASGQSPTEYFANCYDPDNCDGIDGAIGHMRRELATDSAVAEQMLLDWWWGTELLTLANAPAMIARWLGDSAAVELVPELIAAATVLDGQRFRAAASRIAAATGSDGNDE